MNDRITAFIVDFLSTYNTVARIASWHQLRLENEHEMRMCPYCPCDSYGEHLRDGTKCAEWRDVWSVTRHVFERHGAKEPRFGACWSVHDLMGRIVFE